MKDRVKMEFTLNWVDRKDFPKELTLKTQCWSIEGGGGTDRQRERKSIAHSKNHVQGYNPGAERLPAGVRYNTSQDKSASRRDDWWHSLMLHRDWIKTEEQLFHLATWISFKNSWSNFGGVMRTRARWKRFNKWLPGDKPETLYMYNSSEKFFCKWNQIIVDCWARLWSWKCIVNFFWFVLK